MNKRYPTRRQAFTMLSGVVIMSILFQVLLGWDLKYLCLSLPISTLAVFLQWRYRTIMAIPSAQNPGSRIYGLIARGAFWLFVALILFFVSKRFQ